MSCEIFDNGVIRVNVPDGWKLFVGIDSDGKRSSKKVHVYKDAKTEFDILTKAGFTICFYGKDEIFIPTRWFYDDTRDMASFECGGKLWNGYTCTSCGYPYTMLDSSVDSVTFQVMILTENGDNKISLEDEDIRLIIESISVSE